MCFSSAAPASPRLCATGCERELYKYFPSAAPACFGLRRLSPTSSRCRWGTATSCPSLSLSCCFAFCAPTRCEVGWGLRVACFLGRQCWNNSCTHCRPLPVTVPSLLKRHEPTSACEIAYCRARRGPCREQLCFKHVRPVPGACTSLRF